MARRSCARPRRGRPRRASGRRREGQWENRSGACPRARRCRRCERKPPWGVQVGVLSNLRFALAWQL
eukprot:7223540-Pyramimonas_sp.AAC.1